MLNHLKWLASMYNRNSNTNRRQKAMQWPFWNLSISICQCICIYHSISSNSALSYFSISVYSFSSLFYFFACLFNPLTLSFFLSLLSMDIYSSSCFPYSFSLSIHSLSLPTDEHHVWGFFTSDKNVSGVLMKLLCRDNLFSSLDNEAKGKKKLSDLPFFLERSATAAKVRKGALIGLPSLLPSLLPSCSPSLFPSSFYL